MLTSLGKFLRKLRIDRGEILKNMADKLEVSSSFLSAVENGKKRMPSAWNNEIVKLYQLNQEEQITFTKAIAETEQSVEMNFSQVSYQNREVAISFARKFIDFDDKQVEEIKKILQKGKEKNE
ncbi:MAG: helix-turn-helix domain-containing protein [Lachnospiraceae bacterium]|nr:helix-turn-helix domain-containing protein [Lachnospiraceae bacterium]